MTRYGVVGLGIMGSGIATRLAESGHGVHVFNRSGVTEASGRWTVHRELPSLGEACDVVVVAVPTAHAVEAVAFDDGLVAAMGPGDVLVNIATVGPEKAVEIGERVLGEGVGYVDAPVLGSKGAARSGGLVVLAAGTERARQRCRELFGAIGQRTTEFERLGDASGAKLLFNAALGVGMAAVVELLRMSDGLGVDRSFVVDEVLASAVASPAMRSKGQAILRGDQEVHFPLEWMLKDLRLAASAVPSDGRNSGVLEATVRMFEQGVEGGLGRSDFSAVYRSAAGVAAATAAVD